ncbi:hypothetical protein C2845_PMPSC004484 [Panicum miliaceum]|uniref:Uncharacterized protein n=1 Tax=Panicum miliaceum TaxID=4540 RepID=A0A3L6PAJ6_PANMI|nr:hypothetical protein C2845_PMPSC004484 [Panicum miliaceum]
MGALAGAGRAAAAASLASDLSIPGPRDPSSTLEAATGRHRSASRLICAVRALEVRSPPSADGVGRRPPRWLGPVASGPLHTADAASRADPPFLREAGHVMRLSSISPGRRSWGQQICMVVAALRCIHGGTEWEEEVAGESWSWFLNLAMTTSTDGVFLREGIVKATSAPPLLEFLVKT